MSLFEAADLRRNSSTRGATSRPMICRCGGGVHGIQRFGDKLKDDGDKQMMSGTMLPGRWPIDRTVLCSSLPRVAERLEKTSEFRNFEIIYHILITQKWQKSLTWISQNSDATSRSMQL